MSFSNEQLYLALSRLGKCYQLSLGQNPEDFLKTIDAKFGNDWKPYNPRKLKNRMGLSITSLDGELSGIPDLDSIIEYNTVHNVKIKETDIKTPTPVYQYCKKWLDPFEGHISRTHLLKLQPGGYFPNHRDNISIGGIKTFRLIVPLKNCNYPLMFFMVGQEQLNFNHGYAYFIDTCLEHTVFNASVAEESVMMVINVDINEETARTVGKLIAAK